LINPKVDSSGKQILFTNKLIPLAENMRKIVKHYDEFGFGNGFQLANPAKKGEYSHAIDLLKESRVKKGRKFNNPKKIEEINKEENILLNDKGKIIQVGLPSVKEAHKNRHPTQKLSNLSDNLAKNKPSKTIKSRNTVKESKTSER
jgi:hypothetical protein